MKRERLVNKGKQAKEEVKKTKKQIASGKISYSLNNKNCSGDVLMSGV